MSNTYTHTHLISILECIYKFPECFSRYFPDYPVLITIRKRSPRKLLAYKLFEKYTMTFYINSALEVAQNKLWGRRGVVAKNLININKLLLKCTI